MKERLILVLQKRTTTLIDYAAVHLMRVQVLGSMFQNIFLIISLFIKFYIYNFLNKSISNSLPFPISALNRNTTNQKVDVFN